jgi:hypothetical protein
MVGLTILAALPSLCIFSAWGVQVKSTGILLVL